MLTKAHTQDLGSEEENADAHTQITHPKQEVLYHIIIKDLFLKNFNVLLFIFERERQSMNGGGAEREGNTESEAAPGSELSAQSLKQGLTHESQDCDLS